MLSGRALKLELSNGHSNDKNGNFLELQSQVVILRHISHMHNALFCFQTKKKIALALSVFSVHKRLFLDKVSLKGHCYHKSYQKTEDLTSSKNIFGLLIPIKSDT